MPRTAPINRALRTALLSLFACALAATLAGTAGVPAARALPEKATITVTGTDAPHDYEAYQVFAGPVYYDLAMTPQFEGKLATWGSGVTAAGAAALGDPLAAWGTLQESGDADAFAQLLVSQGWLDPARAVHGVYNSDVDRYTIGNLEPGYYLVRDAAGSGEEIAGFAAMPYTLCSAGNIDIVARNAAPNAMVLLGNATADPAGALNKTAAAHQGDALALRAVASLPDALPCYDAYALTLSLQLDGLADLDLSSVAVEVGETPATEAFDIAYDADARTLTASCADLHALDAVPGGRVALSCAATLTADPAADTWTPLAYLTLTYANDPNEGGEASRGQTAPAVATVTLRTEPDAGTQPTETARARHTMGAGTLAALFGAAVLAVAVIVGVVTRKQP